MSGLTFRALEVGSIKSLTVVKNIEIVKEVVGGNRCLTKVNGFVFDLGSTVAGVRVKNKGGSKGLGLTSGTGFTILTIITLLTVRIKKLETS